MTLISEFCKENKIKRKKMILLFNHFNQVLKSRRNAIFLIDSIIKDFILSGTTKKNINVLICILNKTLNKETFDYKTFCIICELCPCLALQISRILKLSLSETKKILSENELVNKPLINLLFIIYKDTYMINYMMGKTNSNK